MNEWRIEWIWMCEWVKWSEMKWNDVKSNEVKYIQCFLLIYSHNSFTSSDHIYNDDGDNDHDNDSDIDYDWK